MTRPIAPYLCAGFLFLPSIASAGCPSTETLQKAVQNVFKQQEVTVEKVTPSEIPGLCDVQIRHKGQRRIIYSDRNSSYLLAGQAFRVSDGGNLTQERISELNRFLPAEMERLSALTAFTVGNSGPVVYFVTDPQCPYCQKAEAVLGPMAERGEITLKVLFYPLSFHRGAKEECISIICDNKGLDGLRTRYRSENQCEDGKRKVEETVKFLSEKGITGTPSYIFPDGLPHSGVLDEVALKGRITGKKGDAAR
ncbi:MAG: DsbC family protein [Deltaproteobacteria bacterium]